MINIYLARKYGELLDLLTSFEVRNLVLEGLVIGILLWDGRLIDGFIIDNELSEPLVSILEIDSSFGELLKKIISLLEDDNPFECEYEHEGSTIKIKWNIRPGFLADSKLEKTSDNDLFELIKDKPWQEIKDLFHYNLISYHRHNNNKFQKFLEDIDLIKATYYSNHLKLNKKGFEFIDLRISDKVMPTENIIQPIQDFIDHLEVKKWYPANDEFDKHILEYLYRESGYKKTVLAKSIHLSYQAVRNKFEKFNL